LDIPDLLYIRRQRISKREKPAAEDVPRALPVLPKVNAIVTD
jgi:hypothetical protein